MAASDLVEDLMITRSLRCVVGGLAAVAASGVLLTVPAAGAQDEPGVDKIPKQVMDCLKGKFPKAGIHKWAKEKEGGLVVYDIEFKQEGRKFEADIEENGTIHNWEREIAAKDLPDAVKKTVDAKYPRSTLKEIMEITAVTDGEDALEGYEVVLETVDKEEVEITVAPDGKILEESGAGEEELEEE